MEDKKKEIEKQEDKETNKKSTFWEIIRKFTDKENLITIIITIFSVIFVVVGFASGAISCTYCGDDENRLFIYASGTTADGYQYKSCAGPAGILGFGIDSKCWPTECLKIKHTDSDGITLSGCVNYYNAAGCIAKSDIKSEGKYTNSLNCLSVSCIGAKYVETTAETTKASQKDQILGISSCNSKNVDPKYYNNKMPRQFIYGCWSNEDLE